MRMNNDVRRWAPLDPELKRHALGLDRALPSPDRCELRRFDGVAAEWCVLGEAEGKPCRERCVGIVAEPLS